MASVRPFSFAAEFREGEGGPATAAELEAELAELRLAVTKAREEGRAEGFAEALSRLQAERDTALQASLTTLGTALSVIEQRFDGVESALARLAAGLAHDLAEQLAAQAVAEKPAGAVDEAIGRALREVRRGRPIEVRVAPDLVPDVERCIAERQAADRRRLFLTVIPDAAIAPGDARIAWESGALVLDRQARSAFVAKEVEGLLSA